MQDYCYLKELNFSELAQFYPEHEFIVYGIRDIQNKESISENELEI